MSTSIATPINTNSISELAGDTPTPHRNLYAEWLDMLKADEFDAEQVKEIHALYRKRKHREELWANAYAQASSEWANEARQVRAANTLKLGKLSKRELWKQYCEFFPAAFVRTDEHYQETTKADMLDAFDRYETDKLQDMSSRARPIYKQMIQEARAQGQDV